MPLNTLASQLDALTANHEAYPVLHYIHSARARNAPAVSVVVLDESLTVLRFGAPGTDRLEDEAERRRRLRGLLESDCRAWPNRTDD